MNRFISLALVAMAVSIVLVLLADTYGAALGDGPHYQGYLAVALHLLGYLLVAAVTACLVTCQSSSSSSSDELEDGLNYVHHVG